jgi:hypothetical protein
LLAISPADNSTLATSLVTITGTIADATTTVKVALNGGTPQFAAITGNSFSITLNLLSGMNTFIISASDLAGKTAMFKRTIHYDINGPGVEITDPVQDNYSYAPTMLISGKVSDALSAVTLIVSMDGNIYTPQLVDGVFQQQLTFTTTKQYAITATSTDLSGNSTTVQRNVIYLSASNGDLNRNGSVDIGDALLALRMAVGLVIATDADKLIGDVSPQSGGKPNPDGKIDISDALLILRRVVGLVTW